MRSAQALPLLAASCLTACGGAALTGCSLGSEPNSNPNKNDRESMEQAEVTIHGHTFHVAVARTLREQELGLMNVPPEELGRDEGMLFVFPRERLLAFWMKNTITPLDIAYINADGRIIKIHTMKARDESHYPSGAPAKYALEVHAGRLAELSIREGDMVQID